MSYAVGTYTDDRLGRILDQVYSASDTVLYVFMDNKKDAAVGIVGFKRAANCAEILHIAVDEQNRKQGIGRKIIDELVVMEHPTERAE